MKESTEQERGLPLALRTASMAFHRNTDAKLGEHGVTADQFVLLLALSECQALTQRELANRISADPSTARAMLVLLEKTSLVRRGCHPTNSRAKTVSLTAAGKRKIRKLGEVGQSILDDMHGCMTQCEAKTSITLLQKIACTLKHEKQLV